MRYSITQPKLERIKPRRKYGHEVQKPVDMQEVFDDIYAGLEAERNTEDSVQFMLFESWRETL